MMTPQSDWHRAKRRQGWKCKLDWDMGPGHRPMLPHDGPCPLVPLWHRHPIIRWRMR